MTKPPSVGKPDSEPAEDGAEGGACFGNGTCNDGLACVDDVCEAITAQVNGLILRGLLEASVWDEVRLKKALRRYLSALDLV